MQTPSWQRLGMVLVLSDRFGAKSRCLIHRSLVPDPAPGDSDSLYLLEEACS